MTDHMPEVLPAGWERVTLIQNMRRAITDMGHKRIPVEGFFSVYEPEKYQREALIWKTLKANGDQAQHPEEAERCVIASPIQKGGTETEWDERVLQARSSILNAQGLIMDRAQRTNRE